MSLLDLGLLIFVVAVVAQAVYELGRAEGERKGEARAQREARCALAAYRRKAEHRASGACPFR